jgi:3-oxoacyl-(acyl-carrier-protein) synthase
LELELRNFNSSGFYMGDCWNGRLEDANLLISDEEEPVGIGNHFGTGTSGIDKFHETSTRLTNSNTRLGSTAVAQTMNSGISAYLGGKLGLGNQQQIRLLVPQVRVL